MVLTAATTVRLSADYGMNAAWMAVVFILIGFPCICLGRFRPRPAPLPVEPRALRMFNMTMAVLLILSLYPLIAHLLA